MGRNEIKLREKRLTADTVKQYRNYSALVKKVQREKQYKQAVRIFLISLVVTCFVLLLIFMSYLVIRWEREREKKSNFETSQIGTSKNKV
jgi:protein-S-isoprenylcysteine O-methyltransferase Ste14